MKQVLQNYKTGELQPVEVHTPILRKNFISVRNVSSLLSVGTKKSMIEMAEKSSPGKALPRPALIKQVVANAKTEQIPEASIEPDGLEDLVTAVNDCNVRLDLFF